MSWQSKVAVIRALAEHITGLKRVVYDIDEVTDAVDALLDRSVGAEEYVIRTVAEGGRVDPYIDLSKIDFESLAKQFGNKKRAETERLAALLKSRAEAGAKVKPVLSAGELVVVRASAKRLQQHLQDKLVLDWRRMADASAGVKTAIKEILDEDLPADPYPPEMFDAKVTAIFDHILTRRLTSA